MSWAKLDDQIFAHPKIINLSKDAKLLHLAGITYCAGQLTDGLVTPGAVRMISAQVDVDPACIAELIDGCLWEVDGKNYRIHDYLIYNPSGEQVRAERANTAKRVAEFRQRKASRNAVSNSVRNGVSNASPSPSPSYDSEDTNNSSDNLHVAADADDATPDAPPATPTRSEQKNAKGKKRAPSTPSPASGASFAQDSTPYQLAAYLRDAILAHKPDANVPRDDKRLQSWAVITDRMVRLDKRDPEKIRALMDWATQDGFWSANILSPGSFRDHYDQLELQRTRKAQVTSNSQNGNGASGNGRNKPHGAQTIDEYSREMSAELERLGYGK